MHISPVRDVYRCNTMFSLAKHRENLLIEVFLYCIDIFIWQKPTSILIKSFAPLNNNDVWSHLLIYLLRNFHIV